jgi:hypothetical protein
MINAYFCDLDLVVAGCRRLLRPGGRIGFVVASSAYGGVVVPVAELLGRIFLENNIAWREHVILRETSGNGHHQKRRGQALRESLVVGEAV